MSHSLIIPKTNPGLSFSYLIIKCGLANHFGTECFLTNECHKVEAKNYGHQVKDDGHQVKDTANLLCYNTNFLPFRLKKDFLVKINSYVLKYHLWGNTKCYVIQPVFFVIK
jgi:hypothetical protein